MDTCPRVLSVCSGVGGLHLGLRLAVPAARVVCFVEIEAYPAGVLVKKMAEGLLDEAPVWTDLRAFDGRPWRGRVDCLIGGYPCQPFSVSGRRRGKEDPRHLWPHLRRVVEEAAPRVCFFENVAHHLRLGFDEVHDELEGLGYRIAAGLFTAAEVGLPHRRERLFILAHAGHGALPQWARHAGRQQPQRPAEWDEPQGGGPAVDGLPGCGGTPLFPPAPADLDAWADLLGRHPELAPGLPAESAAYRMVDGHAARVDQLGGLGNVVVPLVAAHAFRTLARVRWEVLHV